MNQLHITFVLSPDHHEITIPEVREARTELREEGLAVETLTAPPEIAAPDTLYLTDSPVYYEAMQAADIPAAGYLHQNNQEEPFLHCSYVISEPQWVDADSYHKIYERLTGQPWTILTTERLVVREMTTGDLDALYDLYDAQALRFMEPLHEDRDVERSLLAAYIDKVYGMFGYGYWALTLREGGELIGRMGFAPYEGAGSRISFGYVIHRDYRRQGYALEAARAILPYAMDVLQLSGISADVHAENLASVLFLKRLGFRKADVIGGIETYVL